MARQRKPVSGPGKLSQRTDLAQPIRAPTGGPYGQRLALETAQRRMPLPNRAGGAGLPAVASPPAAAAAAGTPPPINVFGPTLRPLEPVTAGAPVGPGNNGPLAAENMDTGRILQVMARLTGGSPAILRLLEPGNQ